MRSILSEIKKSLYPPLFILSCAQITLVCCLSEGYTSASGRTYTIMELLLFLPGNGMFADISLNRYDIWLRGAGTWSQLLFPFLVSTGYLYTIANEKLSGLNRLLLIRENNLRYGVSKLVSAMVSGGILLLAGYLCFGCLIYARFPSVYEYPMEKLNFYMEITPDFKELLFCLNRCGRIFLYGMCINVFAYLVAVFFRDKYILGCLPLMLKYLWGQAVMKVETDAVNKGNEAVLKLCSGFRPENILIPSDTWKMTLLLTGALYLAGFCLTIHFLEKKGEGFGFE